MINKKTQLLQKLINTQTRFFHILQKREANIISTITKNNTVNKRAEKKQLIYIQQNNFFDFFKKKPQKMSDPESKSKSDEWYEIEEALVFQDKKYPILKVQNTEKNIMKFYEYGILFPLTLYTGYKFAFSLITLRPLKTIMWGGFFLFSARLLKGINTNKYLFILGIDLMEDGKNCLVTTAKEQMIVDIKSIRRLSQEEAVYYSYMLVQNNLEYIPIIIKKDVFLIFKNSNIFNKEIFSAITSGKYIKVKDENLINKEDAIDIK
jgi:hypothetical protein